MDGEGDVLSRLYFSAFKTGDVEGFSAVEIQRLSVRAFFELARQHAHADEVAAVDAFEALCDYGFDAKQASSLCGPVAGRAGAVFLASQHYERRAFALILHCGVVDAHSFGLRSLRLRQRVRPVDSHASLNSRDHQVLDAHVREGAAHHHLVIAAPRTVAVEVGSANAAFL